MTTGPGVRARLLPMGDAAILVEADSIEDVLVLESAVRRAREDPAGVWDAVIDVVPAARTLLLTVVPGADLAALGQAVLATAARADRAPDVGEAPLVEVPVSYTGPDLAEVGRLTGLGADGVVAAHTASEWRVGFGGFAPGFAYLVGGDARLEVARRESPRTRVPAGSVGLAGRFSGVYPRESPGGWQLIGTTDVALWDVERDPPALMRPGAVVRFVDLGERR